MPNSLKCKIKRLCHNGTITERERDRILKALEQEPKTGHWIKEFNDIEGEVRFTCSSCGEFQLFGTDFCPNCGSYNGGDGNVNE